MNITFYELTAKDKKWVKAHYPKMKALFNDKHLALSNLPKPDTEVISIHTGCTVTEALLKKMPNLKLIITRTAGVDHIDLTACRRAKVVVANCPGMNAVAVAEFVFGLILDFYRQISESLVIGKRLDFHASDFVGTELAGKTVGIVGTGAIGAHVAQIAKGFGMNVIGFDFHKNQSLVRKLGLQYVSLKALFQKADVISLHIPATPMTQKIINRALLSQVKKQAVLVNTARGSIVDSEALLKTLKAKKMAGYLTDVMDHELELKNGVSSSSSKADRKIITAQKELAKMPNVYITPHMAYASSEASDRILKFSLDTIDKFSKGKKIQSVI